MGGFSVAATLLGEPDFGYLTQTEMADAARRVCRLTDRPVLVDADTGYGNALNVIRTVELYQDAGAAGLFLEDQVWPKRCGHMRGKRVVERARVARRSCAPCSRRAASATCSWWRAPTRAPRSASTRPSRAARRRATSAPTRSSSKRRSRSPSSSRSRAPFPGPKVANMVEHGKTPLLSPAELHQLGFDLIVTPLAGLLASAKALQDVLRRAAPRRHHARCTSTACCRSTSSTSSSSWSGTTNWNTDSRHDV